MTPNMKRWLTAVICITLGTGLGAAQKQRYSESHRTDPLLYPLTLHVTAAHILKMPAPIRVTTGDSGPPADPITILHLTVVIDGKTIELETGASALLHPGDYQARVMANDEKKSGWFSKSYELLFNDGTHVIFTEVGESQ